MVLCISSSDSRVSAGSFPVVGCKYLLNTTAFSYYQLYHLHLVMGCTNMDKSTKWIHLLVRCRWCLWKE